jgi:RNA polymerase sigma-70 factor (ECF subfamily)
MADQEKPITELLRRSREGDTAAPQELADLLHREMRKLAGGLMKSERAGHTLQPTALVHEAWIRMQGLMEQDWRDRRQFFAAASTVMRQILVDFARTHRREKRGSGAEALPLDNIEVALPERSASLIALDDALQELEKLDPRKVRIIEMRYFGGMTVEEIAEELNISASTIGRDLRMASTWITAYVRE